MDIAILVYPRFTALDAVGPYEVLSRLPDARVTFVAEEIGPKRTDTGQLALQADATLDELAHPEIVEAVCAHSRFEAAGGSVASRR